MIKKKKTTSVRCSIHVESWQKTPDLILSRGTYTLVIDYPLTTKARFTIKVAKSMGFAALVSKIVECYRKVYAKEEAWVEKYGKAYQRGETDDDPPYSIWGHAIDDLSISQINVNHKTKRITLDMSS